MNKLTPVVLEKSSTSCELVRSDALKMLLFLFEFDVVNRVVNNAG